MTRRQPTDHSWRHRVGADPWRNLIATECDVLGRLSDGGGLHTRIEAEPARSAMGDRSAFGWRWRDDARVAVEIDLAGRTFLCEPSVESVAACANGCCRLYVTVLTWDEELVSGLEELLKGTTPITVITSWWLWEEVVRWLPNAEIRNLSLAEVENGCTEEGGHGILGFDESVLLGFGSGVEVHIDMVPSRLPALRASFICNGQRITVSAHAGLYINPDALRTLVWERIRSYPSLHEVFLRRYGQLEPQTNHRSLEVIQPDDPIDTRMLVAGCQRFTPQPPNPLALPMHGFTTPSPLSDRELLRHTAFAIFCAGVNVAREGIDPGRRLEVRLPDAKRQRVVSILTWRLAQLSALADIAGAAVTVLLVVSADTERIVRDEVDHLDETLRERLEVVLLRQQLVPKVFDLGGRLFPVEGSDGGWSLTPPGHLDLLPLLARFDGPARGLRRCMAFAHNNLGALLLDNGEVQRLHPDTRQVLAGDWAASLAVEVFELKRLGNDDADWAPLSFVAEDVAGRLVKLSYPGTSGELVPKAYSSHTWYIDLTRIGQFARASAEYLVVDGWPRQEMEQVTHGDVPVRLISYKPAADRAGLYTHPRFLVARTEDDIRKQQFLAAFHAAHGRAKGEPQAVDEPLLILTPAEMKKVWGGDRLRIRKGLPPGYVGESWELSTNPAGPSIIHLTIEETLPLSELLRRDHPDQPHLPIMAKYLDCEQPLSVQLHPGPEAIEALANLGRRPNGPRVRLADEHAKAENFFVLEPANSTSSSDQCHLLLGFEERKLLPIIQELQNLTDLNRLLDNLQASVKRHADKVLKEIGITEPVGLQLPGLDAVTGALVYHLRREQNPLRLRQAVAAVGVIWMIWSLTRALPPNVGTPLFRDLNSPLLRHFRRVTLRRNQWVRIMPGMIHSWQGGGNIMIELSDRSDNTFRIIDYGREFRHTTQRDMHYLEAMYAVTPDAVMDNEGALRCIHTMSQQDDCLHGQITARLIVGDGGRKWVPLLKSAERSFVMNPDGPVRLRTEGIHRRELTLGACRTALIAPDTHASVLIIRPNDRVLHIWPAQVRG